MAAPTFNFLGHGANVVGSLGSGSLVQDMPVGFYLSGASTAGKITIPDEFNVKGNWVNYGGWVY